MDKDSNPGVSLFAGNGIVALLVIALGALVLHETPLQGTRPAANEPRLAQRFAAQDVEARLWQDPLGAVVREREDVLKPLDKAQRQAEDKRHDEKGVLQALRDKTRAADAKVTVLAVMLPGGPYAENVENRRRTRYAVLAALNASRYAPADTEHLGYFLPAGHEQLPRQVPDLVPFEWFEPTQTDPALDPPGRVLVLWLDAGAFQARPLARIKRLAESLSQGILKPRLAWRVIGPTASDGMRAMVDEVVAPGFPADLFGPNLDVRLYSPWATVPDSTLLKPHRLDSSGRSIGSVLAEHRIQLLRTIGDDRALANTLIDELQLRGLKIRSDHRQAGDDLRKRDAYRAMCQVKAQLKESPHHIAVVSEWDTLYGRSLRREFMVDPEDDEGFCVSRFSYVRGLDGLPPDRGSPAPVAAGPAKPVDPTKDDLRRVDGSFVERAEGQSQFDYLRRLAARLRERDQELRASSVDGAGLRAIGVLGNDVHDKLLVLQALRPEFPNAIFFTTDLDTRFLHPNEQAWARNLLVVSNFGLRLDDGLQAGAPPFRDSYQTSTFFTSLLVLDEQSRRPTGCPQGCGPGADAAFTSAQLQLWLARPRIFEIGRSAAFDFSSPANWTDHDGLAACRNGKLRECQDVHPPGSARYPQPSELALALLASGLVFLLWFPPLALSRFLRRKLRRFAACGSNAVSRWWRRGLLLLVLLVLQVVLPIWAARRWPAFADWLTQDGKPVNFTEGISIWPTEGLHLLTLLLCLYLVFRGWTLLSRNLDRITLALHLGRTRRQLIAEQDRLDAHLGLWRRLCAMFGVRPPETLPVQSTPKPLRAWAWRAIGPAAGVPGVLVDVDGRPLQARPDPALSDRALAFWRNYIVQNRGSSRFVRSSAAVLVAIVVGLLVFLAFGEPPGNPLRGALSARIHRGVALAVLVALNFLVFGVADATWFGVRFVRSLRLHRSSWPAATLGHFRRRLGALPAPLLDHWIDLQFIAQRSRAVTGLIYYPFIVLSLLLFSRNPVFDNWQMPTAAILMAVSSICVVLACAIALRLVAEKSRSLALADVKDALVKAHSPDKSGDTTLVPAQIEQLRRQIEELKEGAFAPFSQQPLLKAAALPLATLGGSSLLDYLALANL